MTILSATSMEMLDPRSSFSLMASQKTARPWLIEKPFQDPPLLRVGRLRNLGTHLLPPSLLLVKLGLCPFW